MLSYLNVAEYIYINDSSVVADYRVRARVLGSKKDQDCCPQRAFGSTRLALDAAAFVVQDTRR